MSVSHYETSDLSAEDIVQIDCLLAACRNRDLDAKTMLFDMLRYLAEDDGSGGRKNKGWYEVDPCLYELGVNIDY